MNKTAIKNFAVWARQKFISDTTYQSCIDIQKNPVEITKTQA